MVISSARLTPLRSAPATKARRCLVTRPAGMRRRSMLASPLRWA